MDRLTFFSNAIDAVLSWPVAIIVAIWILREPLKDLIRSLENLAIEAWGVRFDMSKRLNEAKQEAEEADVPALEERVVTDDDARYAEKEYGWLYKLAETYPRSAVMEAWVQVETEARELAARKDINVGRRASTFRILDGLTEREIIPRNLVGLARDLAGLRNNVAHETGAVVTMEQAIDYVNLAVRLADHLNWLNEGN